MKLEGPETLVAKRGGKGGRRPRSYEIRPSLDRRECGSPVSGGRQLVIRHQTRLRKGEQSHQSSKLISSYCTAAPSDEAINPLPRRFAKELTTPVSQLRRHQPQELSNTIPSPVRHLQSSIVIINTIKPTHVRQKFSQNWILRRILRHFKKW